MLGTIYDILFFAIPAIILVLLGVSIYRYVSAKNKNKQAPGTFSPTEMKNRKMWLIIASVIVGVLAAVVIGFMALMFMAVAFM